MPPIWLIRFAIGAVWLYEGVWCKLLRKEPRQFEVVAAVPRFGPRFGAPFLLALGAAEAALGVWAFSGAAPRPCAIVQTALLAALNANGLLWARRIIHDPAGMVLKNFAFLLLVWVSAA